MSWIGIGRHLRLGIEIVGVVVACVVCSVGCGNPEAPKIENVRLSYWESFPPAQDPIDPNWIPHWEPVADGAVAPQSPIRIEGTLSDNTAVVNPRITWIGERGDLKEKQEDSNEEDFVECRHGGKEFYECVMDCEEAGGFFACKPALRAAKLIRGDRFRMTGTQADGEAFELEVSVSEAQKLKDDKEDVDLEYRIFRVSSLKGDPGLIWSVYQSTDTDCGTWDRESAEDCKVDGPSSAWRALRSGDSLCWDPAVPAERDCSFRIALKQGEGEEAVDSANATWRSLVKWNDNSFLTWDATTGFFEEQFQLFDPRDKEERGKDEKPEGELTYFPTYRFVVSAEDVPDQKTKEFRYSEVVVDLPFSPDAAKELPDLELDGEDEDLIETSQPGAAIGGTVLSFSGEVRSLLYRIYDPNPKKDQLVIESQRFYVDPGRISLEGRFSETIVYVSDWKRNDVAPEPDAGPQPPDGVVDPPQEKGIPNNVVEVVALDVQGNSTRTSVSIAFTPPTTEDAPPELQVRELFPAVDNEGKGLLPFGEEMRVRARAADDRGQPAFSAWECHCEDEELAPGIEFKCEDEEPPRINADYYNKCEYLPGLRKEDWVSLNAGGEYPWNPWEWIVVEPASETEKSILLLRAKEKVEEAKNKPVAKFTAIPIYLEPSSEEQAYDMTVGAVASVGPAVGLVDLKNGDIVPDPNSFVVEATVLPRFSELNQITALYNGSDAVVGTRSYDSGTGVFVWDLNGIMVKEGDRICVGAVSVTGHATLDVLEFAETSEGLLLGVTVTTDPGVCGMSPCPECPLPGKAHAKAGVSRK